MVMGGTSQESSIGAQLALLALVVIVSMLASSGSIRAQEPTGAPLAHPPVAYKPPQTNDWANWKRDCHHMFSKPWQDDIISCATDTFRSRPSHFVAHTVVPGSRAGGVRYSR